MEGIRLTPILVIAVSLILVNGSNGQSRWSSSSYGDSFATDPPGDECPIETIEYERFTCTADAAITATSCTGRCTSSAKATIVAFSYYYYDYYVEKDCQCCSPSDWYYQYVTFTCTDGSTFTRAYQVFTQCTCQPCYDYYNYATDSETGASAAGGGGKPKGPPHKPGPGPMPNP